MASHCHVPWSPRRLALAGLVLAAGLGVSHAQIPDRFTNLKVLPADIAKPDLVQEMRQFAVGLGVRCTHCHVGDTPGSLEGVDFATDEKEEKRVARAMLRMVREINGKLLPASGRQDPLQVGCVTCHRGIQRPQTLTDLVLDTVRSEGADTAAARYRELRDAHLGDGAYDFSARTLNAAAEALAREHSDLAGAEAMARLNIEFHPEEAPSHALLAQLLAQKGDRDGAVASLQRALDLDPGNRFYTGMMQRLKAAESED